MDSFELDFAGWRGAAHAEVKVQGEPPRAGGAAAVFAASINARDALLGGKIDIGITAIPNFLSAAVADAGVIGVAVDQCASTAVMVKPDAPHRSVVDFKGKRIASQTATATYGMFVNRVLPQSGLNPPTSTSSTSLPGRACLGIG